MTKEKKAIIVGASSGIGYEVARLLLQEGWRLGLAARRSRPAPASGETRYSTTASAIRNPFTTIEPPWVSLSQRSP